MSDPEAAPHPWMWPAGDLERLGVRLGAIGAALGAWTPEGFFGALFRTMGAFVWPPVGLASSLAWGNEARLAELFAPARVRVARKAHPFRSQSADHLVALLRTTCAPVRRTFAALGEEGQRALHAALTVLVRHHDAGSSDAPLVPAEYLEAVITR